MRYEPNLNYFLPKIKIVRKQVPKWRAIIVLLHLQAPVTEFIKFFQAEN